MSGKSLPLGGHSGRPSAYLGSLTTGTGIGVISLRTSRSTGGNLRCIWEHMGALARSLGAPMSSLGGAMTSLGAPATSLATPRITVEQSGKNNVFCWNAAGEPGYHSYYLSFNNFYYSCILIYVSI